MRAVLAAGLAAAIIFVSCGGCSTTKKMPSISSFGKSKTSSSDTSKLTNAPAAPYSDHAAAAAPQQQPGSWSNLPVYPGTTYPRTPHPELSIAAAQQGYAVARGAYGAMPPSAGAPATPYPSFPPAAGYVPPAANPYAQQAAPPYAPPASPYAQPAATSYAGQPAPPVQAAAPYGQPTYGQPPYAPPVQPHTAANPYGNVPR